MFAKNQDGTFKRLSVITKPAADTPRSPYASGYGPKIPSGTLALIGSKWQRVYVACYSNSGSPWVQVKGERVLIDDREPESGAELFRVDDSFSKFVLGYIECLKWSTSGDYKGRELDSLEGFNFHVEAWDKCLEDCKAFYESNRADIFEAATEYETGVAAKGQGMMYAGHDFWLTRVGHGAGFCDGDLTAELAERLTSASKAAIEVWPIIGDNKLIHVEG